MLAPQPETQLRQIESLIPDELLTSHELQASKERLAYEVTADYELSLRKSIGRGPKLAVELMKLCHLQYDP